jgi:phosphate transport system substrate-binding protein
VAGSGSNIVLTQKLLDAYAAKTGPAVHIPPSIGTAGAVKALLADALDLGLASRPLKETERAAGLREIGYARLGVVIGAHASVPDDSIGAEDLTAIYRSSKRTWSNGKTIIVLAREAGDSSNMVLERLVPGFKEALAEALGKKRWDVFYTDQDEFEAARATPNSLSLLDTSALTYLAPAVKALKYEGTEPSLENIAGGAYPFWKDLTFIYRERLTPAAQRFVDFVLSDEGTALLRKHGALPVPVANGPR